ncbi:ankyrin repeat domain-containing protein 26 [Rhynchonycteris naso]
MKKIFGFGSRKGVLPLGSPSSPGRSSTGDREPGYHLRDKDLGKIHKAASAGNVAKVKQILLLRINGVDDRDRMNRTALHLACANGHPRVVKLLADKKCLLNLCDNENRTALIKAVQCQEEECATLLLERGADPNLMDIYGNTALHYAALGENQALVDKLLDYEANIDVTNKDNLTPLSLAKSENSKQMMELLLNKGARGNQIESNHQLTSEYKEERRPRKSFEISRRLDLQESPKQVSRKTNSSSVNESSEEDSLRSKPGIDDSWPPSDDEDFEFDTKNVMKPSLAKLMTAIRQSQKNIEGKYPFVRPENRVFYEDSTFHSENEDMVEALPNTSENVQGFSQPALSSLGHLLKASFMSSAVVVVTKEEASAPQNKTNNNNLTYVDEEHKHNHGDKMSALGLGEDEDVESPWDSESSSASLPQKSVDDLPEAADQRGKDILNGQVEDVLYIPSCMSRSRNFKMPKVDDTRNVGVPVAHIDSPERYSHLKPAVEVQGPVPEKAVGRKRTQPSRSDLSAKLDLAVTSQEEQERLVGCANDHPQVEEENKMHTSSEMEVQGTLNASAAGSNELTQQRRSEHTDNQRLPVMESEGSDWSSKKTFSEEKISTEENKVKEKIDSMDDLDDLPQSSETVSEHCELPHSNYKNFMLLTEQLCMDCKDSVNLLKIQDAVLSYERLIELRKNHCELLTGKIERMENRVTGLHRELSASREMTSQAERQRVELEQELRNLRFTLKEEKEKRRNTDVLYDKIRDQLREKEEQYIKEVEMNQQLETTLKALEMELKIVRKNLNQVVEERNDTQRQLAREQNARKLQDEILTNHLCKQKEIEVALREVNSEVSDSYEKEEDLFHENQVLQDEVATLKLEIDTVKNQNQEIEKKYFEDIAIVKENNDHLQKTIKLNEETLTKTIFQYNEQLDVLRAENKMLTSKLENERQNKERLETEVDSYQSRLAAVVKDHEQSQMSKRDQQLAFQRARGEWFCLQDKLNFDLSNLKDSNEILSQQLSKAESKLSNLEIELQHTRDALRERTLVLEGVQRDLSQTECQKKEFEHMYQKEQGKVNKYIGKQGSLEERLSHLQSENVLLRQQLDDAHNKAEKKEKTVINIQDQFQDIIKLFQAESEKQGIMLNERNKELINECNHLKERMYQYENDKAERDAVVRQLQQELADTLKKQSMSEASLEVTSRYRMNLEDETLDLKKKLDQSRCQLQEAQNQCTAAIRCAEETQDHRQRLEIENAKLKVTIKKQAHKLEQLQTNLLETNLSQDEKEQLKKHIELKQSLEYSLDQEVKKNTELEKEITRFKELLNITKRKLNEYENQEHSFPGNLKPNQIEMDIQINMLKHKNDDLKEKLETASSKCLRLDEKKKSLQQELLSMKAIQKKCEKLENKNKKLKQEIVNLKRYMELNMVEHSEVEQHKRKIEERARQDIEEKMEQVNLVLQTQRISQENLEQLIEYHNASIRSQLELRNKDMESEVSKMKTRNDDLESELSKIKTRNEDLESVLFKMETSQYCNKIELEKYKQLYLDEIEGRKSLANKLNKTQEKLAEVNTELLLQKERNTALLSTVNRRHVPERPCVGNIRNSCVLNRISTPGKNLVIPTSKPWTANNNMETYLIKMRQEFEKTLTRELKEEAAEFESESCTAYPVGSIDRSNSSQDLLLKATQEYAQILKKNYMI